MASMARWTCTLVARRFQILVIAISFFSIPGHAIGGQRQIPDEARKKWADYMELAKGIQGSSSEVVTDRLANNKVLAHVRYELKIRGFATAFSFQEFGPQPEPKQHWYVRNEQYAFELRRKTNKDSWVVAQLHQDIGDGKNLTVNRFLNETTTQTHAPLKIYRNWLPEMVGEKEFVVKKYDKVRNPRNTGSDLMRVDFEYNNQESKPAVRSGWFLLDPSLYWLVAGYEVNVTWGGGESGKVSYTADFKVGPSGTPLLAKSVERTECLAARVSTDRSAEYNLDEHEPAAEEFTLSAFGLPELGKVGETNSRYLWFGATGLLCLAVAIMFWFRTRRAQSPT
jgi:hypothetical protein